MPRAHIPAQLRRLVTDRARSCCEYCRSQAILAPESFSIEHIVPRCNGGLTIESNLALSCQGCTNHKAIKTVERDPVTGSLASFFNPREQDWGDHFAWNDDYTTIEGLTPTGRATVVALRLNRKALVNLRRVLYAMGEHPPAEPEAAAEIQ